MTTEAIIIAVKVSLHNIHLLVLGLLKGGSKLLVEFVENKIDFLEQALDILFS